MRVLILGAGAVGGLLGGTLAAGGADVILVARGARGRELAARGLRLERGGETRRFELPVAEALAPAATRGPFDAVLLTLRGMDLEAAGEEIAEHLPPCRLVVMLNGVGHEAALAARLPRHAVCSGALTAACWEREPAWIQAGAKGGLGLECRPGDACDNSDLAAVFRAGGLSARCHRSGASVKWSKLLLNLLGSATTAILGWPPARVFADRRLFRLELAAWREAMRVMRAMGVAPVALPGYPVPLYVGLARGLPAALLQPLLGPRLAGGRGDRLPGPATDLARGRSRTECEWLGGAVARAGAGVGLAAPVNAALSSVVAALAAGRLPREAFYNRPERLLAAVAAWPEPPTPQEDAKP